MKLYVPLSAETLSDLTTIANAQRRTSHQQAVVLLEQAIEAAVRRRRPSLPARTEPDAATRGY